MEKKEMIDRALVSLVREAEHGNVEAGKAVLDFYRDYPGYSPVDASPASPVDGKSVVRSLSKT